VAASGQTDTAAGVYAAYDGAKPSPSQIANPLDKITARIRDCRICRDVRGPRRLPHAPRPVFRVSATARLLVASQAPGIRVHETGLPFNDPSGDRLRQWMSIDRETLQNQAATYASKIVPEAKGEASKITQAAEAYRLRTVAEAKGAASRFDQVYAEFKKAPDVTRQRMYLETMERVLGGMDKIVLDQGPGQGPSVLPYLPLGDWPRRPGQGAAR